MDLEKFSKTRRAKLLELVCRNLGIALTSYEYSMVRILRRPETPLIINSLGVGSDFANIAEAATRPPVRVVDGRRK